MNINRDFVARKITDILSDPTNRLDVIYWKNFAVDFNENSKFQTKKLAKIGFLRNERVSEQNQKLFYYPFKVTYTGEVILKEPLRFSDLDGHKFKVARSEDIVFSRINCCRGAIGIVEELQDGCICTNETHVYKVTDAQVDNRYIHIILRHPYYQDLILSKSTGQA